MADFPDGDRNHELTRRALAEHAADLARALDEPNAAQSSRRELRFGRKGSLSVIVAGHKAGVFFDHENGEGGDLFALVMRQQRCNFREALDFARDFVGMAREPTGHRREWPPEQRARVQEARYQAERDEQREKIKNAACIWRESTDPRGTLVERYLASRGLTLPDEVAGSVLRYHPALLLDDRRVPGMLALLRDIASTEGKASNHPCGIHRTFLDEHVRKIKPPKMLGRAKDAAVKLSPDEDATQGLHICEGVETGLAALLAGYRPTWALGSAGSIAKFPALGGIEALTLLAERNDGGANQRAAAEVGARWQAAEREVFTIEVLAGDDLNDAWREGAS